MTVTTTEKEIIEALCRVEEYNDQFRQPNPNGANPICKPTLFNIEVCERCGSWIKGVQGACPAVPPDQRWGADYVPEAGSGDSSATQESVSPSSNK